MVTPAADSGTDAAAEDTGVNCENGIDTATGAECDGGPAVAQADEATETPSNEADEGAGDAGVNCENGIDTATGNECDGGPAAAQADEATEAPSDEPGASIANGLAAPVATADGAATGSDVADDPAGTTETETDAVGDEAQDGVDHQFEGEETGENGNGIPDADDANESEAGG